MATAALTSDSLNDRIQSIPGLRQGLVLLGLALAVAAGVWLFMWSQKPGHVALFSGMGDREAAEVADALRTANVPYRIDPTSGAITVPHANVHEARMRLASQGLPSGGTRVGVEAIQGDQGFGVSQFVEGARYQHALETELARTVATLRPVRDARVHLALPKPSAFARAREPAGASVVVDLVPGRTLDSNQVNAIVNLLASSISELSPERVTVVDQGGRLLSQTDPDSEEAHSNRQFEQVRRLETTYAQRVRELLEPLTGAGRTSVQVTMDMDFSAVEEAREVYSNDPAKLRSEQVSETTVRDAVVGGVPGATANTPPGEDNDGNEAIAGSNASRSATRNYELDRTLTHTRQAAGRLRRVSAAVLVDHIPGTDAEGAQVMRPLSEAELARVEGLVRDAIGFDAERGDSVSVMNAAFVRDAAEPFPGSEVPLWQQPWVRDVLRLLAGAVVLLALVFGVLRPMLQQLVAPAPLGRGRDGGASHQLGGPEMMDGEALEVRAPEPDLALPPSGYEKRLDFARQQVGEDPKRVAQVVKAWVGNDG